MGQIRGGKAFNARLPLALHRAIKADAKTTAKKAGGQANMNKLMVELLYAQYKAKLNEAERVEIEAFIARL